MAAKKLVVYIWSFNTIAQTDSIVTRQINLANALKAAYADLRQLGRSDGLSPEGLFIAPEYLFANPVSSSAHGHTRGSKRQLEEGEKDRLVTYMKDVSRTMPGLLIIAGSVAWRKPFARPAEKQRRSDGSYKMQSRFEKAKAAIEGFAKMAFPTAPDALWQPLSGDLPQSSTSRSVVAPTSAKKLDDLSVNSFFCEPAGFVGRNTAYVLLDGRVLFKYNKRGDFHEVLHDNSADGTVFVPGIFDGRFEVRISEQPSPRAIQFGLEICLDHASGMLGRTVASRGRVDVHLITSAIVAVDPKNVAVKHQGYLVHACSEASWSKVQVCPALIDVPGTIELHGNTVTAYVLDLHSVPDVVPAVPDAVPLAPDAAPVLPDAAPVVPDAAPVVPDAVPTVPEAVPAVLEAVSTVLEAVSPQVSATPTDVSTSSERAIKRSRTMPPDAGPGTR